MAVQLQDAQGTIIKCPSPSSTNYETIVFTLLLMLFPWALRDLEINMLWCYAGVARVPLNTDCKAHNVFTVKLHILDFK